MESEKIEKKSQDVEGYLESAAAPEMDLKTSQLIEDARQATEAEHGLGFWQAFKRYPNAVGWSLLLSTAVIMEGYDTTLLTNFYAMPQFAKRYGEQLPSGEYTITAAWQAGLSNGVQVGEIIGLCVNGWASERFGYKKTMIASLTAMIFLIFIPFFAQNVETLLAAEILQGIPWGVFQTLTTAYAAEVAPVALRPYLTAYVNICWVFGQLIAGGVLRGVLSWDSEWAYRVPFALQWVWPVPILVGTLFAPESPWWLVRQNRHEDAKKVIARLARKGARTEEDVYRSLALMVHTNALEKSVTEGTSYWQCFKGVDRRRTEIAAGTWATQNLCGSAFMGYSTFFLEQAGLPVDNAFNLTIGQYGLGICGTIASWLLMNRFGRRTLYNTGLVLLFVLLIVVGGMGFISQGNTGAQWAVGGLLLTYTAIYDATVGPVCYTIVAEIPATRLRAKTVVIARIVYNIMGIVNAIIMPYFLNTGALNWGAKTGLFWAGLCFLCFLWCFFRVPEAKGRTYGELDVLFETKVPARKFAKTTVDQFQNHGHVARRVVDDKNQETTFVERA